jgi:hypothetical protein
MSGSKQHESGARVADLGARHQRSNVLSLGVHSTLLQAVADRFEAGFLAALTSINTLLHSVIHLLRHRLSPVGWNV